METPSGVSHSAKSFKKLVLEEEIVREIKALWTDQTSDVRTALLKEMFGSVVKLRDLDTDVLDAKNHHWAYKELRYAFQVFGQYRDVKKVSILWSAQTRVDGPGIIQSGMKGLVGSIVSESILYCLLSKLRMRKLRMIKNW